MAKTDLPAQDKDTHTFLHFARIIAGKGWVGRVGPGIPFRLLGRSRYNAAVSRVIPAVPSQFA